MDWPWDGLLGQAAGCGHMLPLITCTNRIAVAVLCCTRRANSFLSLVDRILLNRGEPSSFSFLVLLFAVLKFSARLVLLFCCCSLDEDQTKKSCTFSQHLQTHKANAQKLYLVRISEFCLYILFSSPFSFLFELVTANYAEL